MLIPLMFLLTLITLIASYLTYGHLKDRKNSAEQKQPSDLFMLWIGWAFVAVLNVIEIVSVF